MGPQKTVEKCMTLFEYIKHKFVHEKRRGKKGSPEKTKREDHNHSNTPPKDVEIFTLAVVLDGVVQEVIRAEARMAALILSEPVFVDVTELTGELAPTIGWVKTDSGFEKPVVTNE